MGNPNFTKVNGLSELKGLSVKPGVKGQEQPYLDREGLREKIANSPVLEGIPDINTPESRERQVIRIPKNSRLAVELAFAYRNNPDMYQPAGLNSLQNFLEYYFSQVVEGDEETLNQIPESCWTPESCREEMTDEEIKNLISKWKHSYPDDEQYQKQCDEYLEYLLGEGNEEEVKKENNVPESEFNAESVTIDESRLPYILRAEVKVPNKTEKIYFVHLPEAVRVATSEEKQKYAEAFRQVLAGTQGNFFPRFDARDGKLVVAMGPSSKRSTWQPVIEFSPEELSELTGRSQEESQEYIFLRGENWTKLDLEERRVRDDFESIIQNVKLKSFSSANEVRFNQTIRNLMVAQRWIASIGETRFEELKETAGKMVVEKNRNRWNSNDELLSTPEFQVKVKDFLNILKQRFGSWEKVLGAKSALSELANLVKLRGAEALYVLGKEVLIGARQEFLAEYEKLYNLSADDLKEYLKDHPLAEAPENETLTKAKILKYSLLGYVRARPMEGDVWNGKKINRPEYLNPTASPEIPENIDMTHRISTLLDSLTPEEAWRIGEFLDKSS